MTVAADVLARGKGDTYQPLGVRYYRASITAIAQREEVAPTATATPLVDGAATSPAYVATALPMLVTPLPRAQAPASAFTAVQLVPGDPALDTVTRFLSAYLAGDGELSRYVSPSSHLNPVMPAPYREVEVTGLALPSTVDAGDEATSPQEGVHLSVLVTVSATTSDKAQEHLSYPLELTARGGRWEVTGLRLAVPLAPVAAADAEGVATTVPVPTPAPSN